MKENCCEYREEKESLEEDRLKSERVDQKDHLFHVGGGGDGVSFASKTTWTSVRKSMPAMF